MDPSIRRVLRRALDERSRSTPVRAASQPESGWLRSVRDALGMNAAQLARRLGIARENVLKAEQRERRGTISLAVLDRMARAMGCRLVYCIVPVDHESLDALLLERAHAAAVRLLKKTSHSMRLEEQGVADSETLAQLADLTRKLEETAAPIVWDEP